MALNYGGKILKTSKAIQQVIKPKVLELQDNLGQTVDRGRDIYKGLKEELNESEK